MEDEADIDGNLQASLNSIEREDHQESALIVENYLLGKRPRIATDIEPSQTFAEKEC